MADHECKPTIRTECAKQFGVIAEKLVTIAERSAHNTKKLDEIGEALLGNGDPSTGLYDRFTRLETRLSSYWAAIVVVAGVIGFAASVLCKILL